jgi:hypothetical protein
VPRGSTAIGKRGFYDATQSIPCLTSAHRSKGQPLCRSSCLSFGIGLALFRSRLCDLNLSTIERRFEKTFRNKSWRASPPRDGSLDFTQMQAACLPTILLALVLRLDPLASCFERVAIPHNVSAQTVSAPVLSASRRRVPGRQCERRRVGTTLTCAKFRNDVSVKPAPWAAQASPRLREHQSGFGNLVTSCRYPAASSSVKNGCSNQLALS